MKNSIELQLGKWGNSLGVRIPKPISDMLELKPKDKISCTIEDDKLILKPIRHVQKYSLKRLLAEAEETCEEISWGKPEGEEIW
jgi:antitoxin MazE